jgi:phosphogluconate dehydratase
MTQQGEHPMPLGLLLDAKNLVNGLVGLLASGGSTNHTMHLVAIAAMAGYCINWDDFAQLSTVTPLIARIYPNGYADINDFQKAGGMAYFISTLLEAGLLHLDVHTVMGQGLEPYTRLPVLDNQDLHWIAGPETPTNPNVLTSSKEPFTAQGGLQVLAGNLGRAIIKTSSLSPNKQCIEAEAVVCTSQDEFNQLFKQGKLDRDCIVVLRFQGPKACGMPELHQLTPKLGVLMDKGYQVALVTDGRMSGASGKVPAAIHVTPEAIDGGGIARIQDGDRIQIDCQQGLLNVLVAEKEWLQRPLAKMVDKAVYGMGRELFASLRSSFTGAEQGACSLFKGKEYLYDAF